jgi:hypothetical protein
MTTYFGICFAALLVGNGILFLLRFRPLTAGTMLAAPGVAVAVVASVLVTGRMLGISLSVLIDWIVIVWAATEISDSGFDGFSYAAWCAGW